MKIISAIIRPFVLDDVRDALTKVGIQGMTVYEVKGFGRQRGHTHAYRGEEYAVKYIPKLKIELLISDDQAPAVVDAVMAAARTGKTGDGKVYVQDVANIYRIRTGEMDDASF